MCRKIKSRTTAKHRSDMYCMPDGKVEPLSRHDKEVTGHLKVGWFRESQSHLSC